MPQFKTLLITVLLATGLVAPALGSPNPVPTLSTPQLLKQNPELKRMLEAPPHDRSELQGKRVAILAADGAEAIEIEANRNYFQARGARVELLAPRAPQPDPRFGVQYPKNRDTNILTVRFMENAKWLSIDRFIDQAKAADYDALIIPGGTWNPDILRTDTDALSFIKKMDEGGKIIAAICHGPLVLINAGLLRDRAATATWNVQLDLKNAGARVSDQAVVVDGRLITSRHPIDLPAFVQAITAGLKAK